MRRDSNVWASEAKENKEEVALGWEGSLTPHPIRSTTKHPADCSWRQGSLHITIVHDLVRLLTYYLSVPNSSELVWGGGEMVWNFKNVYKIITSISPNSFFCWYFSLWLFIIIVCVYMYAHKTWREGCMWGCLCRAQRATLGSHISFHHEHRLVK